MASPGAGPGPVTPPGSPSARATAIPAGLTWNPERPRLLVVTCSDGRLQEATDDFLARQLGAVHYDRLYVPGGGGALASSGPDFLRAQYLRRECRFLVDAHGVEHLLLLFHAPAPDGPELAMCADYRRKLPQGSVMQLREQQERDARELLLHRRDWAGDAQVLAYRCEVGASGTLTFVELGR